MKCMVPKEYFECELPSEDFPDQANMCVTVRRSVTLDWWKKMKTIFTEHLRHIYHPKIRGGEGPLGPNVYDEKSLDEYLEGRWKVLEEHRKNHPRRLVFVIGEYFREIAAFQVLIAVTKDQLNAYAADMDSSLFILSDSEVRGSLTEEGVNGYIVLQEGISIELDRSIYDQFNSAMSRVVPEVR